MSWVHQETHPPQIENYPEPNEKENTVIPDPWHTVNAALRRKFTAGNSTEAYLKKQDISQINGLISHLRDLEKGTRNEAHSE